MMTPHERTWSVGDKKPWWADDPDIAAIQRAAMEEIERWERVPIEPDKPDPVLEDFLSGASIRELSAARDDLARANARYADAIQKGRAAGLSWGEIGRILGVSRQQLHRRFSRPASTAGP
jgi:DNA-directed RNA polymerase specialized sigma24 family protein